MSQEEYNRPPTALEETRLSIPKDDRVRIQELVVKVFDRGIRGHNAVQEVCLLITAELFAGNIQPDVANAARPYVEILLTSITAQAMQMKDQNAGGSQLAAILREAKKKQGKTRPLYLVDNDGEDQTIIESGPISGGAHPVPVLRGTSTEED